MCGHGRPISVLHVLGRIDRGRGGSAAATLEIAAATRAAGDDATILTTRGGDEDVPDAPPGVKIVGCRRQWPQHVAFSVPLVLWLLRHVRRFDLVEVHEVFAFPALAAVTVARCRRVPYVVRPHGSLGPHDLRKHARAKALLRPGLRWMLRGAAGVWLATAREEAGVGHLGGRIRTVVSPLPVPSPAGDRAAFRRRYDLGDDDPVVLFLGRLHPVKGLSRLISAFETAADRVDRARLVIAGSGDEPFASGIRARAASSRHAASIRTPGFLSGQDKADAFAGADLFALHSDNESFGIAPVEAARAGTPVLLSDEVYVGDELAAAGAAAVVGVGDASGLAERLATLLGDPSVLREMAAAAGAAIEPYLPQRVADRDASVRRDLLAGRVTRSGVC